MMTRERTELRWRRGYIFREGGGNRSEIAGLILCVKEAETRCYRLRDKAEASRFELRAKGKVKADIRRSLEVEAERRRIIKANASTR